MPSVSKRSQECPILPSSPSQVCSRTHSGSVNGGEPQALVSFFSYSSNFSSQATMRLLEHWRVRDESARSYLEKLVFQWVDGVVRESAGHDTQGRLGVLLLEQRNTSRVAAGSGELSSVWDRLNLEHI